MLQNTSLQYENVQKRKFFFMFSKTIFIGLDKVFLISKKTINRNDSKVCTLVLLSE